MSAAPVYPESRSRRATSTSPRTNVRKRPRRKSWTRVAAAFSLLFAVTVTLTFGFSTLLGYSMKEAARHDAIKAGDRARSARADMGQIRARIERLSTMKAIEEWSQTKGFVTNFQLAQNLAPVQPKTVIAPKAPSAAGLKIDVVVARMEDGTTAH